MELFPTLNMAMSYTDDVAELTVKSVNKDSGGAYRCVAVNDAGDDEVEAKITVEGVCLMFMFAIEVCIGR